MMPTMVDVAPGRRIALDTYGDPDGVPWLYLHATNSARAEGALFHAVAATRGIRIVTLDRPGIGDSSPAPGQDMLGWAADVAAVADALCLGEFVVGGWSAGAAHALACGYAMPERIRGVLAINPATPASDPEVVRGLDTQQRAIIALARRAPWVLRKLLAPLMTRMLSGGQRLHDPRFRQRALRMFPPTDRGRIAEFWSTREGRETFIAMGEGSARQGSAATARDLLVLWGGPGWGFDPAEISVPLRLFAGTADSSRDYTAALAVAAPNATMRTFPGGHHGFLADAVLAEVCDAVSLVSAW